MIFQSSKFKVWVSPPFRVIFSAAAIMPPTPSHYPTSTHLTSDYLWQVDENAVTHRQKTLKLEKKES